jgi:hypothetical protein
MIVCGWVSTQYKDMHRMTKGLSIIGRICTKMLMEYISSDTQLYELLYINIFC